MRIMKNSDYQAIISEIEEQKISIEKLKEINSALEKELNDIKDSSKRCLAEFETEKAAYQAIAEENQARKQVVDELKQVNLDLRNALTNSQEWHRQCLKDKEEAEQALIKFRKELAETVGDYDKYQGRFIVATSQVKDLDREIQRIRTSLIQLNVEVKTAIKQSGISAPVVPSTSQAKVQDSLPKVLNVDAAIKKLKMEEVRIDTENYVFKDLDPEPPIKRKYEYSEKCLRGDYIAFDLETTGLSPKNDYIIELSAVRFRGFKPVSAFSTLINPVMVDIPANITRITGIHDDDVLGAPMIQQVMQSFTDFIGTDDMVGHNIRAFDLKFLYRFGFEMDESNRNYYDTLSMARKLVPEGAVNNNKLETLLDYFGITRSSAHRGLTDSLAEGMLFAKLMPLQTKKSLV